MKYILLLLSSAILSSNIHAQNNCATYFIDYSIDSIKFTTANFLDYGDSMIVFSMTNNHPTQGFAYPMSKLEPVTPLPPGMTVNPYAWYVFGSSWPPDFTYPTLEYFYVDEPIPANYMVTFKVWAKNLDPLLDNTDSCVFDNTFTINLNPVGATGIDDHAADTYTLYPQPADNILTLETFAGEVAHIEISDLSGRKLTALKIQSVNTVQEINVSDLNSGIYLLQITTINGKRNVMKFVKA